jgi:hypothetical protein
MRRVFAATSEKAGATPALPAGRLDKFGKNCALLGMCCSATDARAQKKTPASLSTGRGGGSRTAQAAFFNHAARLARFAHRNRSSL